MKIRILNHLGPAFKTYLTVVNDQMRKDKKLEKDDILFKAIEEEETRIKADHRGSAKFASTKSNVKPQGWAAKGKEEFVGWPKCGKFGSKHLADKICKHANKDCNKCHKRRHISRFHDTYISLNRGKTLEQSATSSSDSKKNVTYVTQVVANKMFETGFTRKIIADSGTIQHLIANCELIRDYYDNHSEYQTGSVEVLSSYRKGTLILPLANSFLKLANVWYAQDLSFNLIRTIQLGEKGFEMWLQTTDKPSQNLHDGEILGYVDAIDGQYVLWVKETSELPIIANSTSPKTKKGTKPYDIKHWHSRMRNLEYRSQTILKNLRSGIEFHGTIPAELCGDCRKGD